MATDCAFDSGRRRLLAAMGLALAWPHCALAEPKAASRSVLVSGYYRKHGNTLDNQLKWQAPLDGRVSSIDLSFRGHGLYAHPTRPATVVLVARRPGTQLIMVDLARGDIVRQVSSAAKRHFYGHAVFSNDGSLLYTTENDFTNARGVIGVRDSETLEVVAEFPSGGVGPHDVRLLSDGRTLVVANGGIRTHPEQPRRKLNIPDMRPNLAYVDRIDGELLERHLPPDHQLSVRHLSVADDDQVIAVQQYEGKRNKLVPLVLFHRRGAALRVPRSDDRTLRRMNWYTASAAIDHASRTAMVTCPRGNLVTLWDTERDHLIRSLDIRKPYGVALAPDRRNYAVSCADGALYEVALDGGRIDRLQAADGGAWDNHLIWIDRSV